MQAGQKVYILEADFGILGRVFLETPPDDDLETVMANLMSGDYHGAVKRVIAVDPDMADVSADIAQELVSRAWRAGVDLPGDVRDFCSARCRHESAGFDTVEAGNADETRP
jgi:hypothetical protein